MVDPSKHSLLFLDTEFTQFQNAQLISLGLVRVNDQFELAERFYVEVEFDLRHASDWVMEYVEPKLAHTPVPKREAARQVAAFLASLPHRESVICFDFPTDWDLLAQLLGVEHGDVLTRLNARNVDAEVVDTRALIPDCDDRIHHALRDAEHLARGWLIKRALELKGLRHG
jgi:hypothetical protein